MVVLLEDVYWAGEIAPLLKEIALLAGKSAARDK